MNRYRILVHDLMGHSVMVHLSRELASRGHRVLHSYAEFFQCPKGDLKRRASDPSGFSVEGLVLRKPFQKYSYFRRFFQEIEYGKRLSSQIESFKPDTVILANMHTDAQHYVFRRLRNSTIRWVFWIQDLHGLAVKRILGKKYPIAGDLIGEYYVRKERRLVEESDALVLITGDFRKAMMGWNVNQQNSIVIPNWAPIEEFPVRRRTNPWSQKHNLDRGICFIYSGTLGLKHNPDLLLQLATHFRSDDSTRIVVISEGLGADYLRKRKAELDLDNLLLLNYQPYELVSYVYGTADVLVAILEPDAASFSVPSKVLSYLCARRPILLAIPPDNLAATIVSENNAGVVVDPRNTEAFIQAAETLKENRSLRQQYGNNGRKYAEEHFDIVKIGDQFESIIFEGAGNN